MTGGPRIAVVIPVFNGAATIARSVRSALDQGVDLEVIVVDDGSTDDPSGALRAVDSLAVRVVRQENSGVCRTRNRGVEAVTAPFVVFLDADDVLLDGALSRYLEVLDPVSAPMARASLVIDRGDSVKVQEAIPFDPSRPHPRGPKIPGSFAISTELFRSLGGYVTTLTFGENTELLLRATIRMRDDGFEVPVIAEPAARIHRDERGRAVRYGAGPSAAATYILANYADEMANDPAMRHDYCSIVGASRLRSGDRRGAITAFGQAVRAQPGSGVAWARLVRALAPLPSRLLLRQGAPAPLVMVVTPGGGLIRRGYEAFAAEFADQLAARSDVRVRLLQGGPSPAPFARRAWRLNRHRLVAKTIARVTPLYATSVEHYSFGVASLLRLLLDRPDVMILSERVLANFYGVVLPKLGVRTRIVLRNGGSHRPPFRHIDGVIHHTPDYLEAALAAPGETAHHVHIPYAFDLEREFPPEHLDPEWKTRRRGELGLPTDRPVILTVGALDKVVKKMDHVVTEVGQLTDLDPFLVLLGQREDETPEIEALAARTLGDGSWRTDTVTADEVTDYFACADVFILASPREGFGRVYVEALTAGLPCIAHDTLHSRWVLGDLGRFADMFEKGAAATQLREALENAGELTTERRVERRHTMYDRYSWDRLLPRYLDALGVATPE